MSVAGSLRVSAGYRLRFGAKDTKAYSSLALRLAGTPNAQYYVYVADVAGKKLLRSGWRKTPVDEQNVSLRFAAEGKPGVLELYVLSKDGRPAENRYRRIAFEGSGSRRELDLGGIKTRGTVSARLDLRRAAVSLADADGAKSVVRALADRNVFLITSPAKVSLEEVKAPQLPAARRGKTDGVTWLHMRMPGDLDYKGMEYALAVGVFTLDDLQLLATVCGQLAVAAKGDRKAVSMVTSFDTGKNVLDAAIRLARETIQADPAKLVATHEQAWGKFWSAAGLELGDRFFQEA